MTDPQPSDKNDEALGAGEVHVERTGNEGRFAVARVPRDNRLLGVEVTGPAWSIFLARLSLVDQGRQLNRRLFVMRGVII